MRAADRGGERRGETKERIVIWERRTDWVSKSLAPAGCRRQPAKKRFLCTFRTVNGKFNQSYIEMVISCAACTRIAGARIQPCTYYITSTTRVKSMQVHRVNEVLSHPEMYAHAHMSRMERYVHVSMRPHTKTDGQTDCKRYTAGLKRAPVFWFLRKWSHYE